MRAGCAGPLGEVGKIPLAGGAGPHFLEAGATVDGPVQPGYEGYRGLAAAHGTGDGGQLSAVGRHSLPPTGRPTGRAALRVVKQASLKVEALLPGGEDELHLTITADYGLIFQSQSPSPPCLDFSRLSKRPPGGRAALASDRRERSPVSGLVAGPNPSAPKQGSSRPVLLVRASSNHSRVTAGSIGQP